MSDTSRDRNDPRAFYSARSTRPELEGRLGSVFALSNGYLGLRGSHEEAPFRGNPGFYIAGTYAGGPIDLLGLHDPDHILVHPDRITAESLAGIGPHDIPTLPNFPFPLAVELFVGEERFSFETSTVLSCERVVEFENALLRRTMVFRDAAGRHTRIESRRFVSFADGNIVALEYRVHPLDHQASVKVKPFLQTDVTNANGVVLWREAGRRKGELLDAIECVTSDTGVRVAIAQRGRLRRSGSGAVMEVLVAAGEMSLDAAVDRAEKCRAEGFAAACAAHLREWRARTEPAKVFFDGGPATVQGFNFGQMHLQMALGDTVRRTGIVSKGYTGPGYRFAVFWDMDFHEFPYYLLTRPREARGLLEYRYNQLDAYRENARAWGAEGAQVPWETHLDGREVTAPWLCLQEREIHISADAAMMFALYDELTGDHGAMTEMGAEFIFETARFYASRMKWTERTGRYELPDVGCPDQYHTFADNSFFISMMARWNLEYALRLCESGEYAAVCAAIALSDDEVDKWRGILSNFYIIAPDRDGIIEEFDGYFDLERDLDGISELRCRHSQAVKQPDVLAAFWPFEHLYSEEIRRKNWRFYAARTLHGSSLSHPGMALAAACCGLNDEALHHLHKSARMDLDDLNRDTEGGVHLAGYAVQWHAVVFGFGGLRPRREYLHFRPNLPRQWRRLSFKVHWQFQLVEVTLARRRIAFAADPANSAPVVVKVGDRESEEIAPGEKLAVKT
ncbi:MAG: glycosyl hydrolase family 65 protein [Planctomycetota bacterium]|jgi:kojibiose phosphorylase